MSVDDDKRSAYDPSVGWRRYLSSCSGKVAFDTPELAHEVRRRRTRNGAVCKVYKCRGCRKWHLAPPMKRSKTAPRPPRLRNYEDDADDD